MVAARKGDLVLVETTTHDYMIGAPRVARTSYQFGVVASATREGIVKTWQPVGWGDDLISTGARKVNASERVYVIPAKSVDAAGLLTAAKAHHYPNHPGQPMPFDSLDAAREVARPFRKAA